MTTTNYPLNGPLSKSLVAGAMNTGPYPYIDRETVTAPIYAEQWRIRPFQYDEFSQLAEPPAVEVNKIDDPRNYPYGQLLSRTNVLPRDEARIALWAVEEPMAVAYMNSAFVRQDIAFHDSMGEIMRRKQAIRYKNNPYNSFAPY